MNGLELGSCLLLYCIDGDINGGDLKHSSLSTVPRLCGRSSFAGDGAENSLTNVAVVLAVETAVDCPSALTPGADFSSAFVGDGDRMAMNSCDLAGDEAVCDGFEMSRWSLALVGLRRLGIFTAGVSRRRNGFASTRVDVGSGAGGGADDCANKGGSLMTGGPFGPGSLSLSVVLVGFVG